MTEVEYTAAGRCCAQILWMKQTLEDYNLYYTNIFIYCANTSTILRTMYVSQALNTSKYVITSYVITNNGGYLFRIY